MFKSEQSKVKVAWIGAIGAILVAIITGAIMLLNPTSKIKQGDCSGDFFGDINRSNIHLDCSHGIKKSNDH